LGRGAAAVTTALSLGHGNPLTEEVPHLRVESVELVQVEDLGLYIEGQRRLQEAWARHQMS
jgi:hypothetical protein